ncbi:DcaP family trimeric outer membrane transporter [Colwellia ponticola]|uniref:DcaP family trimeric outer membrane transporter n=1 Tax=Colwellia ponticola TaxID=2304625 RepID=UPI001FE3DFFC|nr:DcaP family trimeric outer membrane transporter [Colwellia ponticola]
MFNHSLFTVKKLVLATSLLALTGAANAGYTIKLDDGDSITFGGYIKADVRTIDGDVSSPITNDDYWIGGASVVNDISTTKFSVNETRFNTKYVHGDVTGFIELDFLGGGGNQIVSNSSHPRLRHAFIQYKNILVGQTWTTFMNTSALAEAADFGGPLNASAFIRQGQVRYTNGGLQLSLENPHSDKGDSSQDSIPDFIAKYTFTGDWGNVSVSGLARQLNTATVAAVTAKPAVTVIDSSTGLPVVITPAVNAVVGIDSKTESAFGFGVAGRINTFGKDDLRFQVHAGNTGRYVGVVAARDLVGQKAEKTTSYMVAYRHFWDEDTRSTVFYGSTDADLADTKRNHVAVNLFRNYTKQLSFGVEIGNFEMNEVNKDSNYLQFSAKYVL